MEDDLTGHYCTYLTYQVYTVCIYTAVYSFIYTYLAGCSQSQRTACQQLCWWRTHSECICFFFSRNIGYGIPKVKYFCYLRKKKSGSKYPKTHYIILKTEALVMTSTSWHQQGAGDAPTRSASALSAWTSASLPRHRPLVRLVSSRPASEPRPRGHRDVR